ncbi:hypothetical protein BB559_003098 [Furculomyces boomerangus]|uniref:Transposase Helix-turn-helix domain-containing protein n=1 Tax=Furculomyces boomerangus TaxID=61424 RepID=A0A2T9YP36_9FUNG|nr:hypothetical protein BB559_003098 [Furculomyces boomerangus]
MADNFQQLIIRAENVDYMLDQNPPAEDQSDIERVEEDDFDRLFEILNTDLAGIRNNRGGRANLTIRDTLLFYLSFLKLYPSYSSIGLSFKMKAASVQRLVDRVTYAIKGTLWKRFVVPQKKADQVTFGLGFNHYPEAALVIDALIQEFSRLAMYFKDQKSCIQENIQSAA